MNAGEQGPRGLRAAVREAVGRARRLAGLQAELARLEVAGKLRALGLGLGLGLAAAVLGLFAATLAVATAIAAIAIVLPVWAALAIVTGGALALVSALGLGAAAALKRGTPPVPEQTIREARLTREALRRDGR